ncbi:MAG TPA: carboxypeptidase-like regulatory domain-containing protein [Candidatus Acidoferrales bacterium]|nr:carboxypeptidase-like regulatory domain-containing protein [Candidatus Acidoferrales bacterium]
MTMKLKHIGKALFLAMLCLGVGQTSHGQTAASGVVLGSITDPSGAAVPGARVELKSIETGVANVSTTDARGGYIFPDVSPGTYSLTIAAEGFRKAIVGGIVVNVTKSVSVNLKLQLGQVSQSVVVSANAVQLQTTNAEIGAVVGSQSLLRLPTRLRTADELLFIQPGATPETGGSSGASVSGAVNDQTTFTLDGIDISDNNDNSTVSNSRGAHAVMPMPVESVSEFRVGVAGADASFGRSSGGQVTLIERGGTNRIHGAAYWYHQNSVLNANSWDNNRVGLRKPPLHDNRFGFRLGGPIQHNKFFYYGSYEGRRFPVQLGFTRLVPTAALRQGILQFKDASGNIVPYNLANSTACGPAGNNVCDPRQLGISPSSQALFALDPPGNDSTLGDGLNYTGYRSNLPAPLTDDFATVKLNYNFNSKWKAHASYLYSRDLEFDTFEVNMVNPNSPKSLSGLPTHTGTVIFGLTGQLTPSIVNAVSFGYTRNRYGQARQGISTSAAQLKIPGTQTSAGYVALTPGIINTPIDMNNSIRSQSNDDKTLEWADNLSWDHGSHLWQFGTNIYHLNIFHIHTGKLGGVVNGLNGIIDADLTSFLSIPATDRPPTCSASLTANCLPASETTTWDELYASTLDLLDSNNTLLVRDSNLNPLPFGTNIDMPAVGNAFSFYGQDTWQIRPTLTFTYGLTYGWQAPMSFINHEESVPVDVSTGQTLTSQSYLNAVKSAALQGQIYNPTLGFEPITAAGRSSVYDTDWGDVGPRLSLAWSPSSQRGLWGRFIGQQKTVFRGGFGIYYDRLNGEDTVVSPGLTTGFSSGSQVGLPSCSAAGAPGTNCASSSSNPAASTFRVGVDGSIPIPPAPVVSSPVVPQSPFGELVSFGLDQNVKAPREYVSEFTMQRQLSASTILEVGWIGRYGRRLLYNYNLTSAPYFMKDPASGQTFAQAYDAVAGALRAGQNPTDQPFFENMVSGAGGSGQSSTAFLANKFGSDFRNGLVAGLFQQMSLLREGMGLRGLVNTQLNTDLVVANGAWSNYNSLIVSLRRSTPKLTYDLNYTFSRSLDSNVGVQNDSGILPNPFYLSTQYGPSVFDRTHAFNAMFLYNLPKQWSGIGSIFNRVAGGWYLSGIVTADSGLPLCATESSQVWGGAAILGRSSCEISTVAPGSFGNELHSGVNGSGGIGTSGNAATGGSGLNIFSNPQSVYSSLRPVSLSTDGRDGRANPFRGFPFWDVDTSVGKKIALTETSNFIISADFFNLFNNVNFSDPSLGVTSPQNFGVVTSELVPANRQEGSRWIMLGLRFEF